MRRRPGPVIREKRYLKLELTCWIFLRIIAVFRRVAASLGARDCHNMLREQCFSAAFREWQRRWRTNQAKELSQERGPAS